MARHLLLFEDFGNNICAALAKSAQKMGFQSQEVNTAETCLEAVGAVPPDAVLMITNNIQRTCAFDVAEAIRARHPRCGFVFLAGHEMDGRASFLAAGYKFHVRDIPVRMSEVMAAITAGMDSPIETFVIPKANLR